jgi:hypothetical protein|tara:strand:+ start:149 stop:277 length:129 start_codon:yes stop_codon:yes gene_type:complete
MQRLKVDASMENVDTEQQPINTSPDKPNMVGGTGLEPVTPGV